MRLLPFPNPSLTNPKRPSSFRWLKGVCVWPVHRVFSTLGIRCEPLVKVFLDFRGEILHDRRRVPKKSVNLPNDGDAKPSFRTLTTLSTLFKLPLYWVITPQTGMMDWMTPQSEFGRQTALVSPTQPNNPPVWNAPNTTLLQSFLQGNTLPLCTWPLFTWPRSKRPSFFVDSAFFVQNTYTTQTIQYPLNGSGRLPYQDGITLCQRTHHTRMYPRKEVS